jgi:hypothetical protein
MLSTLAAFVGALLTSGLLADGSTPMRIAGMASIVLASIGYSWSRGAAKAAKAAGTQIAGGDLVNVASPKDAAPTGGAP